MKKIIAVFAILIFSVLTSPTQVLATQIENRETVILPKDETVNSDYFAWGENVTIQGTINGDAYIAGGKVIVEGVINGDLIAAGGQLNLRGIVANDVRIAAGQSVISGEIGGNLTTLGGSVEITDSSRIAGSLVAGAGSLNIFSTIPRGATIGVGETVIGSSIGSDVLAGTGQLILTPSAQIEGDLTYYSQQEAQIQSGATILGNTTHNIPEDHTKNASDFGGTASMGFTIISFLASLLVGFILIKLAPNFLNQTADVISKKPLNTFLVGLLTVILGPVLILLLLITVIGIPIALMVTFSYLLAIYFAKIFVSFTIGKKLVSYFGSNDKGFLAFFSGLALYTIIHKIPVVGFFVVIITIFIGVGALIISKHKTFMGLRTKNLI